MKSEHCDRYLLHLSNILKASPEFIRWLADVEEIAKNFIYSLFETV